MDLTHQHGYIANQYGFFTDLQGFQILPQLIVSPLGRSPLNRIPQLCKEFCQQLADIGIIHISINIYGNTRLPDGVPVEESINCLDTKTGTIIVSKLKIDPPEGMDIYNTYTYHDRVGKQSK